MSTELVDIADLNNYYDKATSDGRFAPIVHTHNPAGADKQIQYNDGGLFAADSKLEWDKVNGRMLIGGAFISALTGLPTTRRFVIGNDVTGYGRGVYVGKATVDNGAGGGSLEFGVAKSDNAYNRLYTITGDVSNASNLATRFLSIIDNQTSAIVLGINATGDIVNGSWKASVITSAYIGAHTHTTADITAGTFGVAFIGTGVAGAGKYVDGGTGAWTALPAGTPGGANTQVQFNDGGAFGGDSGLVYDKTNKNLTIGGAIRTNGTGGIGYSTGAGGTVTQITSKATGVTLNKITGQITLSGAALAAGAIVSFVLTNSTIAATDVILLQHTSVGTGGAYLLNAQTAAGSATINVRNTSAGSLSEAIVISFAVIKGVTA